MAESSGDSVVGSAFAFDNFIGIFFGFFEGPFNMVDGHFWEGNEWFASNGGHTDWGEGRVAVFSENIGMNAGWVDIDCFGEVETESRRVE